jgi:hypothetical protein
MCLSFQLDRSSCIRGSSEESQMPAFSSSSGSGLISKTGEKLSLAFIWRKRNREKLLVQSFFLSAAVRGFHVVSLTLQLQSAKDQKSHAALSTSINLLTSFPSRLLYRNIVPTTFISFVQLPGAPVCGDPHPGGRAQGLLQHVPPQGDRHCTGRGNLQELCLPLPCQYICFDSCFS